MKDEIRADADASLAAGAAPAQDAGSVEGVGGAGRAEGDAGRKLALAQWLLNRPGRWRAWEAALWLAAFALPAVFGDQAMIINEIAIVALFAISLDLILGYTGIVSLGHAAFFGLGAYVAALFAKLVMPDPLVGMAAAVAAATLLGAVGSLSVMRGTDLTRLMVTIGVALILLELANKMDWLTGGADGLQGVVMGPLLGVFEFDFLGRTAAWYSLAVTLLCFAVLRRVVNSPFGATLRAVRDNPLRARAIGIPVAQRIAAAYTLAAAVAGAAGALLAQTTAFASLDVFSFERSADVLLMLVIGGTGWLYGGVLGAIAFKLLHDVLASLTPQYWMFWLGLFLVVLMLVGRDRLLRPWRWLGEARPQARRGLPAATAAGQAGASGASGASGVAGVAGATGTPPAPGRTPSAAESAASVASAKGQS